MSYSSLRAFFSAIANAIRGKTGDSSLIKAEDFPQAIENIETTPAGWHDTSEVTATAAHVLSPKKIVNAAGAILAGTIQTGEAGIYSAELNSTKTIATAGKYFTGNQTISAITVENLSANSVRDGVTINVKSGGTTIHTVTGTAKGEVKRLIKAGGVVNAQWINTAGITISLPYIEFNTNEVGFIPDAIICIESGQMLVQTIWENKSYHSGILDYFGLTWYPDDGAPIKWVRWQNDIIPDSMSDTNYKIPVPKNNNGKDYTLFFVKE